MMWFAILLIVAASGTVFGAEPDGKSRDQPRSVLEMCIMQKGCKEIALTTPMGSPNEPSPLKDLCRTVAVQLKALDNGVCDPLLRVDTEEQDDAEFEEDRENELLPKPNLASLALSGRTNYFTDCSEIHTAMAMFHVVSSGIYNIKPSGLGNPISVYCDQTTDGGGWTVIQRRFDGSLHFNRPYDDYRYGFGSADGEYWLGLENIYRLTNQNAYELYIELEDWSEVVKYARYATFSLQDDSKFRLNVGGYSGTAGDAFVLPESDPNSEVSGTHLNGQGFSARDVDNDEYSGGSCAGGRRVGGAGGWWYKACSWSSLNGPYFRPSDHTDHSGLGIYWHTFGAPYAGYLRTSKMMVRPVDFQP